MQSDGMLALHDSRHDVLLAITDDFAPTISVLFPPHALATDKTGPPSNYPIRRGQNLVLRRVHLLVRPWRSDTEGAGGLNVAEAFVGLAKPVSVSESRIHRVQRLPDRTVCEEVWSGCVVLTAPATVLVVGAHGAPGGCGKAAGYRTGRTVGFEFLLCLDVEGAEKSCMRGDALRNYSSLKPSLEVRVFADHLLFGESAGDWFRNAPYFLLLFHSIELSLGGGFSSRCRSEICGP